ncbi:hypothetical protein ABDD95_07400 [Mucilaginibacter sp. PAMB04274]|uniref:hypothetical protein n=1 Tax=Mucilaginibacter sp. PAMB04274 TaxID=3138568 RepID=UPI0031F6377A
MDTHHNLTEDAERYQQRSSGILPHIYIAGTDFTIDWRLKELRETAAPWNAISMRHMDMDREGDHYLFFYDTAQHRVWHFDPYLTALPANVVLMEIPNELKLDPYAAAHEYGVDPAEFVQNFPIPQKLAGTVKPLSESGLPDIVAENLEKLEKGRNQGSELSQGGKRGR